MRTRWAGAVLAGAFLTGSAARAQETSPPGAQAAVEPSTPAPSSPPPAPPSTPPSPRDVQSSVTGQWVYTAQYGWIWLPYGAQYTYEPSDSDSYPVQYVYRADLGWLWLTAPWVWGWGPGPYYGYWGPSHYPWYRGPRYVRPVPRGYAFGYGYPYAYRYGYGYGYGYPGYRTYGRPPPPSFHGPHGGVHAAPPPVIHGGPPPGGFHGRPPPAPHGGGVHVAAPPPAAHGGRGH